MRKTGIIQTVTFLLSTGLWSSTAFALPMDQSDAPSPAQISYQQGLQHLAAGRLDAAQKKFEASLKSTPSMTSATLGLAEVAAQQGKLDKAAQLIETAVKNDPSHPYAQASLGRLRYQQRKYPAAIEAFSKAAQLAPTLAANHVALGDAYMNALHDPAKAEEAYRKALHIEPKLAGAHYALGLALAEQKHIQEALAELEKSSQLEPGNPLPLLAAAQLQGQVGQHQISLDLLEKVLSIQPKLVVALLERGRQLIALQRLDEAVLAFEKASAAAPDSAEAHFLLGAALQSAGKADLARDAYLKAIKINDSLAAAYNNLAWISVEQKTDLKKALDWAQKATKLAPDVPGYKDTLGWVYRAQKDLDNANRTLTPLAQEDNVPASTLYHLGVVLMEQGKHDQARNFLQKALDTNPDFTEAQDARKRLSTLTSG